MVTSVLELLLKKGTLVIVVSVVMSFITVSSCRSSSSSSTELEFIISCNPLQDVHRADNNDLAPLYTPGAKTLLRGAIRFYQKFISTQDMPSCNFTPSCSQFGVESIGRLGVLRGVLLTSDRLQRCNSMSTSRYQTDHKSGRLLDPVQLYCEILR